ncbi:hypothetical protein CEW92_14630 [Bacillaceae bacterium SAS-127]|nr:hypothetical protein CEW92_14630 [Bacillaceae bacterium SAS-127]
MDKNFKLRALQPKLHDKISRKLKNGGELMNQAEFLWCDVDAVIPNPKNPRKDPSIKTQEMQSIIKNRGWEEGITVYKRGVYYIIISGHRRWHAAKKMGVKEIPLYIVETPKDEAEELERLGSIQSGQVDWTPYEWAEYTYNMHKAKNVSYAELAKKFNVTPGLIAARIRVYQYYPRNEIEAKVENGTYSITSLEYIRIWIERLKEFHPELVIALGENMVRQTMLRKYDNKCFNSRIVHDKSVEQAPTNSIIEFLTNTNKTLAEFQKELKSKEKEIQIKNYKHNKRKLELTQKEISRLGKKYQKKDVPKILTALEKLEKEIEIKKEYLHELMSTKKTLV